MNVRREMKKYRIVSKPIGFQIQERFLMWWIDLYREPFLTQFDAIQTLTEYVRGRWNYKAYYLNVD